MTLASALRRAASFLWFIYSPARGSVCHTVRHGSPCFSGGDRDKNAEEGVVFDALLGETLVLCSGPQVCLGEKRVVGVRECGGGPQCQEGAVLLVPLAGMNPGEDPEEEQEAPRQDDVAERKDDVEEKVESVAEAMAAFEAELGIGIPKGVRVRMADGKVYVCHGEQTCNSWLDEGGSLVCESGSVCPMKAGNGKAGEGITLSNVGTGITFGNGVTPARLGMTYARTGISLSSGITYTRSRAQNEAEVFDASNGETLVLCNGQHACLGAKKIVSVRECGGGPHCQEGAVLLVPLAGMNPGEDPEKEQEAPRQDDVAERKDEVEEKGESVEEAMAAFEAALGIPKGFRVVMTKGKVSVCHGTDTCNSWTDERGNLVCESGSGCPSAGE